MTRTPCPTHPEQFLYGTTFPEYSDKCPACVVAKMEAEWGEKRDAIAERRAKYPKLVDELEKLSD